MKTALQILQIVAIIAFAVVVYLDIHHRISDEWVYGLTFIIVLVAWLGAYLSGESEQSDRWQRLQHLSDTTKHTLTKNTIILSGLALIFAYLFFSYDKFLYLMLALACLFIIMIKIIIATRD